MKVFIVLGPPGSGKGTQVHLLSKKLKIPFLGMGDLLRIESQKDTPRGKIVKDYIESGEILPWSVAGDIFRDYLQQLKSGVVIFDGIPRNKEQVAQIEKVLEASGAMVEGVIFLDVPEDELARRVQKRYQCLQCGMSCSQGEPEILKPCESCGSDSFSRRTDDENAAVFKRRFEIYKEKTASLIDHYEELNLLKRIDGTMAVKKIHEDLMNYIDRCIERKDNP